MLEFLDSLAVSFDLPILDWIQATMQSGFMDTLWPIITLFGETGIFWMAYATLLLCFRKTRRTGLGMWFAMAMGLVICNMILKPVIGRIRPYDFQIDVLGNTWTDFLAGGKLLVDPLHDGSFPSGHTIASFEASVPLLIHSKLLGIPALILAFAVAFSRLYLYVHYPTDVFFSIIIGTLFGILGTWIAKKIPLGKLDRKGKYEK